MGMVAVLGIRLASMAFRITLPIYSARSQEPELALRRFEIGRDSNHHA
jgi:hypothetical protein